MTLADLLPDVLGRIEENVEAGAPIFWDQTYEILPALVDGMFEASLLTGVVQAVNVGVVLPANTTYISLQNNVSIGIPQGVIAALRMKAPWVIRKATLKGLGDMLPGWEAEPSATQLKAWFPLGVSMFGIYPQLTYPAYVLMDFIYSPVNVARPYTPTIPVPFQTEFNDAWPMYAATMLRTKELGAETEEAETVMTDYLQKMKDLSTFQGRLDKLVLTTTYGARATVNRRKEV